MADTDADRTQSTRVGNPLELLRRIRSVAPEVERIGAEFWAGLTPLVETAEALEGVSPQELADAWVDAIRAAAAAHTVPPGVSEALAACRWDHTDPHQLAEFAVYDSCAAAAAGDADEVRRRWAMLREHPAAEAELPRVMRSILLFGVDDRARKLCGESRAGLERAATQAGVTYADVAEHFLQRGTPELSHEAWWALRVWELNRKSPGRDLARWVVYPEATEDETLDAQPQPPVESPPVRVSADGAARRDALQEIVSRHCSALLTRTAKLGDLLDDIQGRDDIDCPHFWRALKAIGVEVRKYGLDRWVIRQASVWYGSADPSLRVGGPCLAMWVVFYDLQCLIRDRQPILRRKLAPAIADVRDAMHTAKHRGAVPVRAIRQVIEDLRREIWMRHASHPARQLRRELEAAGLSRAELVAHRDEQAEHDIGGLVVTKCLDGWPTSGRGAKSNPGRKRLADGSRTERAKVELYAYITSQMTTGQRYGDLAERLSKQARCKELLRDAGDLKLNTKLIRAAVAYADRACKRRAS